MRRLHSTLRLAMAGGACLLLGACAAPGPERSTIGAPAEPSPAAPPRAGSPAATRPRLERIGRDLYVYHLEWERAENIAETLRPFFERRFGPGVVIVPHPESRSLLIRVPPESDANGRRTAPGQR